MAVEITAFFIGGQNMTVPVSDRLSQLYVGNGTNTRFDFTFRVFDQEDASGIAIRKRGDSDFETVDPSTYSVTINPDNMGGYVVFASAPVTGMYFYIAGSTPLDQILDITNYDNFYPDAIERALDKLTALLQERSSEITLEKQSRILADIHYDSLAMEREENLENRLISYVNAVIGITNPAIFDGIADRMIITEDGRTQRELNNSLPFWTGDYVDFKQATLFREQKIIEHADKQIAEVDTSLTQNIETEKQRAIGVEQNLQLQITTSVGNIKYLETLQQLAAYIPSENDPKQAYVFETKKNYLWALKSGSTTEYEWKDEGKSALDLAKDFAENAKISSPDTIKQFGYYTGASPTTLVAQDGPSAYAVQVKNAGYIKKFRTQLAGGGPTDVRVQVYRPSDKGATLVETRYYTVSYPNSEVNIADNPIKVNKYDLVTLAFVSGIFLRGKVVTAGDPLGSLIVTQTMNIGQQVAISRSRSSLEFQIDLLADDALQVLNEKIDPISRLALGYGIPETISTFKQGALNSPTTTGSFNFAYGNIDGLTKFGKLSQVKFTTRSLSRDVLFRLCVLVPNSDGTYKVEIVKQVVAPSNSLGVVTANATHFDDIFVPKGGYVLLAGTTEIDAPLAQVGISGGFSYIPAENIQLNANVQLSKNSNNQPISIEYTYETSSSNLDERVAVLESENVYAAPPLYSTVLDSIKFAGNVIPEGWAAPNWTIDDNGLHSPSVGGWNVTALATGFSAIANREYRQDFSVSNVNSVFGFCTAPIEINSGAAVALVDGSNKKLQIFLWDGNAQGTLVSEVDIPPLINGVIYSLIVEKHGYFSTVKLINKTTGVTNIVEYSGTNPYVQFHGRAGFIFISGSVVFKKYSFNAFYPRKVKAIVIGDSNSERAATVLPNETWAFKYADLRRMNADVIVAGRSGDETPNFLKRKEYDLKKWQPEYVVWALGTNDTDRNVWRANMQQNIADTLALGAIPILVTQVPRGSSSDIHYLMDEDIRNKFFGENIRYVDFAKAVSYNNDGYTWNPLYNSGDNLHVNPLGQDRCLQQLLIDAPELLR